MRNFIYTITLFTPGFLWLLPLVARAQDEDFKEVVGSVTDFLLTLVPLLSMVAVAIFFWGLAVYVLQAGDEEAVKSAKQRILWGIVGLFFIAALWGVVRLVGGTFGIVPMH